ncbi:MAG: arginase, partial [Flavobacteriaceae bacterium]|nr:arginase [Flavobacteriaceae bacterium]
MTGYVTLYTKETIASFINNRPGEEKFGQAVGSLENWGELASHPAPYVLVGIAEDIGVRANRGIAGTSGAWRTALTALLNIQANSYTNPSKLVVLGEIDCSRQMAQALEISEDDAHRFEKWGALVTQIDDKVAVVVRELVAMGKTPILIGGGHNNSFGNLKGTSEALDTAIHCINLDAHSDFRALEHRHSGNGFSHAAAQGYLDRYYILGLHRNYTSKALFQRLNEQHDTLRYSLFEDIFVKRTTTLAEAFGKAERFCTEAPF